MSGQYDTNEIPVNERLNSIYEMLENQAKLIERLIEASEQADKRFATIENRLSRIEELLETLPTSKLENN